MKNTWNYKEFMQAVTEQLSLMSAQQKTDWIYHMARISKESERDSFLNSLTNKQEVHTITYDETEIDTWIHKLENEEIYFKCESYEVYHEDHWESDYEYEYHDVFGIEEKIIEFILVAKNQLFQKNYQLSLNLVDRLLNLSFPTIDTDMGDWYDIHWKEVINEDIMAVDMKSVLLHAMYATYHLSSGNDRAEKMYYYLNWNKCVPIQIEEVFRIGPEELQNIDFFLEEWIAFLMATEGMKAGELLIEACMLRGGITRLCDTAKHVALKHPVLFKSACEYLINENALAACEKIGLEALDTLPENLVIRAEIADITVKAATKLHHHNTVDECNLAAFYSYATLDRFLTLFERENYQEITNVASAYVQDLPEDSEEGYRYDGNEQQRKNTLPQRKKDIIRYFNGEIDYIYEKCKQDPMVLGWSSGFKGIAIPLFLLTVNKNDKLTKAKARLLDEIVYRLGYASDRNHFYDDFLSWKSKLTYTTEQHEKYLLWLKEEVDRRTEAVVGGKYRKSYYKAAFLIIVLGEVIESNGVPNGKEQLIDYYKKLHPRKRAFKAELDLLNDN